MSAKFIAGVIAGAGAALAIVYLMSDEQSETRKNIKDFLYSSLEKGKEMVKEYTENPGQTAGSVKKE